MFKIRHKITANQCIREKIVFRTMSYAYINLTAHMMLQLLISYSLRDY